MFPRGGGGGGFRWQVHKSTIDTLYIVKPLLHDQIFFDKFHMSV